METVLPHMVLNLPKARIPLAGATGYVLQGADCQTVFLHFSRDTEVPIHTHGDSWGVVLAGEIELNVDGRKQHLARGDQFFVPAGTPHGAFIHAGYTAMEIFAGRDRWQLRDQQDG